MRDKNFYINAIKMDLLRVVSAAGNLKTAFPENSIMEFLNHALRDFEKISLTSHEKSMQNEVRKYSESVSEYAKDPHKRLRFAEYILTIRCRL